MRAATGAAASAAPVLLLAGALSLGACASHPPEVRAGPDTFADKSEKTLYAALDEADATSDQRRQVYSLYDAHHDRVKALDGQSNALLAQWRGLDPHAAGYAQTSDDLAVRWAAISGDRMRESSRFDGEVAAVLDAGQWQRWFERWNRPDAGPRDGECGEGRGYGGGGGGRGRRGGGP